MPGDSNGTIDVDGNSRSYLLHVPRTYDGKTPLPLILDFHALTQSASGQRGASGNSALADQEGIIVAYPQGVGGAFNLCPDSGPAATSCRCCTGARSVDDLGFSLALIDKLKAEGCVDPRRVYATGFSVGGGMGYFLACHAADVVAAVAPSAFDLAVEEQTPCKPSRPVSVISYRGTADAVMEYGGSVSSFGMKFLGAVGTFEKFAEINGCADKAPTDSGNGCQTQKDCGAPGVEVTLCTAQGGGHSPGPAKMLWDRLSKHSLP
jgi:polyhydroxybutyrate depolymerase